MRLPSDSIIAREKLSAYLLCRREDHDKSGFLALAGYDATNADRLAADIREQILSLEATAASATPYGEKFVIRGQLCGPNGRVLRVHSVWMLEKATGLTKFITLYPDRS
jgi:hypothetical protein